MIEAQKFERAQYLALLQLNPESLIEHPVPLRRLKPNRHVRAIVSELVVSSDLRVDRKALWQHAVSPAGVNRELWPILRMTFPLGLTDITAKRNPGEPLSRCWLLLAGVLPIEYDDVTLAEVEPERRFLEVSTLMTQRFWEHERIIESLKQGSRITDRVRFEPRLRLLSGLYRHAIHFVFFWRHRRLRKLFGEVSIKRDATE